jgi:hypothetical protein
MSHNKALLAAVLSAILLVCGGCETAKAIGGGLSAAPAGVSKDITNTCNFIKSTDNWVKSNIW